MSGPLEGLIVADFSRVLAGPYASMLLGDLGADVIKVERPGTGDDTRAWGPPWRDGESTYYLGLNRNKRSVALDLADPADRELARRLAERADVLIESFRPGLMASWGLDGDTIRRVNPRLVSCSVTAFGSGEQATRHAGLRLPAPGDGRADERHRRAGRPAAEGRRRRRRPHLRPARRHRDPGGAGRGRRPPRRGVADGLGARLAAQPGLGLGVGRRRAGAPRQPPPEHRARTRPTRPPTARSRSRSATTACSRGCARRSACPSCRADERFASNEARVANVDALAAELEAVFRTEPAEHWVERAARRERAGRADQPASTRRSRWPPSWASSRSTSRTACRWWRRRCGSTARGRRCGCRRRALDEHGDEIRAWLAG